MPLVPKLCERNLVACGQKVPLWKHYSDPCGPSEFIDDVGIIGGPTQEADVNSAFAQSFFLILRRHFMNSEGNVLVLHREHDNHRAKLTKQH